MSDFARAEEPRIQRHKMRGILKPAPIPVLLSVVLPVGIPSMFGETVKYLHDPVSRHRRK